MYLSISLVLVFDLIQLPRKKGTRPFAFLFHLLFSWKRENGYLIFNLEISARCLVVCFGAPLYSEFRNSWLMFVTVFVCYNFHLRSEGHWAFWALWSFAQVWGRWPYDLTLILGRPNFLLGFISPSDMFQYLGARNSSSSSVVCG